MKLGFEESQTSYSSGSQSARAWTEAWVGAWAYCPHCGNAKISSFPNNSPLADFFCSTCNMTPYDNEDLTELIEQNGSEFVALRSPASAEHDPDYREIGRFPTRETAEEFLASTELP
jgi:hypothetical protein